MHRNPSGAVIDRSFRFFLHYTTERGGRTEDGDNLLLCKRVKTGVNHLSGVIEKDTLCLFLSLFA